MPRAVRTNGIGCIGGQKGLSDSASYPQSSTKDEPPHFQNRNVIRETVRRLPNQNRFFISSGSNPCLIDCSLGDCNFSTESGERSKRFMARQKCDFMMEGEKREGMCSHAEA